MITICSHLQLPSLVLWTLFFATCVESAPIKSPTPKSASVSVTIISERLDVETITLHDATLIKIDNSTTEFLKTSDGFDLKPRNIYGQANLKVEVAGNDVDISGAGLRVNNSRVPLELNIGGYPGAFEQKLKDVWAGVKRFRWNFSGLVAIHSTNGNVLYDLDRQTYEVNVIHQSSAQGMNSNWKIRYLGITPAMLDTAGKQHHPGDNTQLDEIGADLYFPRLGARVEILKAEGRNILPPIWKQWKAKIVWKCPRPKGA